MQQQRSAVALKVLLGDHQLYHSDLQMERWIVARGNLTAYGRYKQALREVHKRYRGLKTLYVERQLVQIDVDELVAADNADPFEKCRDAVRLVQKRMALEDIEFNVTETAREFGKFVEIASALKKAVGTLTPERRDELDREEWRLRLRAMVAVDLVAHGTLQRQTVELLMASPLEWRGAVLEEIKAELAAGAGGQTGPLVAWAETHEVDAGPTGQDGDIAGLLEAIGQEVRSPIPEAGG